RTILEAYGMSETAGATFCSPFDGSGPKGSIGRPLPGVEVELGELGEIRVRGDAVMKGYWNNDALTAKVLRDGWLQTGDLARKDDAGFFFIIDRKDDLII